MSTTSSFPRDARSVPYSNFYSYGTTVAFGVSSSSAQSAAVTADLVRISASTDCYIAWGSNPTATNSSMFLGAGQVVYMQWVTGEKLAAIRDSAHGRCTITPVV